MKRLLVWLLILHLLSAGPLWAATATQLEVLGTPVVFTDSGGDVVLAFGTTASGAGQCSARYDTNTHPTYVSATGARAVKWIWRLTTTLNGTPSAAGATVEVYIAFSDGTHADGELATTNGALTTDKRRNLKLVGLAVVDATSASPVLTASGITFINTRYYQVCYWNATGLAFTAAGANLRLTMTPSSPQMQAN